MRFLTSRLLGCHIILLHLHRSIITRAFCDYMHRKTIFVIIAVMAMAIMTAGCQHSPLPDDEGLLERYDRHVRKRGRAVKRVNLHIDSLKDEVPETAADSMSLYRRLASAYEDKSLDSAVAYYDRLISVAERCRDGAVVRRAVIDKADVLRRQGQEAVALWLYSSVKTDSVSQSDRIRYHQVGLSIGMAYYENSNGLYSSEMFMSMSRLHADSLLRLLPDTSALVDLTMAARLKLEGKEQRMLAPLLSVVDRPEAPQRLKAEAAHSLGTYHLRTEGPKSQAAGRYLVRAAIEELQLGRESETVMAPLSQWFYDVGDQERGLEAWRVAVNHSRNSGSSASLIEHQALTGNTFTLLDKNRRLLVITIVALILLIATGVALAIMIVKARRRQHQALEAARSRVSDLVDNKLQFANAFLNLFALYVESIDNQNQVIYRKLATGHADELMRTFKAGKFITEQGKVLFAGLDRAFLNIFPTFVEELNELMLPDRRFEQPAPDTLTPELRIMAFQRLGIEDSNRIAHLMGLSVNTVYAYRNKVRSRVINRDTFDEDFRRIGTTV